MIKMPELGGEIAKKSYWDETWQETPLPRGLNPRLKGGSNYVNRRFHEQFQNIFSQIDTKGKRLLEIGCARSIWLPYFAKEFGFDVYGMDYSEVGCRQALKILHDEGIDGKILCADFFSAPCLEAEPFDVVVSFGLVEHFQDTAACIAALSTFLKPGGMMVTSIPNMVGAIGFIEKIINRPVYEMHLPIDRNMLVQAHVSSGLEILECDYFLFTNFGVCNLNGISRNSVGWVVKNSLLALLAQFSFAVWFAEDRFGPLRSSRFMSPYIHCYARKRIGLTGGSDHSGERHEGGEPVKAFTTEVDLGERFEFGKNWSRFLSVLDETRISEAEKSLKRMLDLKELSGKRFLDIGSGSGLFSLAARRLGAHVYSFDYDPRSVACTEELKRRYFPGDVDWGIEQGSILDRDYIQSLGKFDIVYSWGVLHHTGAMWQALENAGMRVADGGRLFISIYNDQLYKSVIWRRIKRFYCSGWLGRGVIVGFFFPLFFLKGLVFDLLRFKNPVRRYTEYKRMRGMAIFTDWFDWLGGYPFEVAKPEEIFNFYHQRGYRLQKLKTCGAGLGCNEFVFIREH